mmetsp:Transcript_9909/g.28139  ORF Transcript_9909/g.28139 Transcript_9909/m.28139 type:complete len:193 (-) Transcript_9909:97-675(-)
MQDCNMLLWVVDSNDRERLEATRDELMRGLQDLNGVPLLVFANKQDLPHAMTAHEIAEGLELQNVKSPWHVQACCATSGDGLNTGLAWAVEQVEKKCRGSQGSSALWGAWPWSTEGSTGPDDGTKGLAFKHQTQGLRKTRKISQEALRSKKETQKDEATFGLKSLVSLFPGLLGKQVEGKFPSSGSPSVPAQ